MTHHSATVSLGRGTPPLQLSPVRVEGRHPDGTPRLLRLDDCQSLDTPLGQLVPRFSDDSGDPETRRPPRPAIELYPNGVLKALSLEAQTPVATSLGLLPAERLLFHPDGSLRRLFPQDGKLSAYRSWQDEKALAPVLRLDLPPDPNVLDAGRRVLEARCISLLFFPSGALQSVSLWTEETVRWPTPVGPIPARIGLAFHENGALASLEPARPVEILSPLGPVTVFDPDPEGVSGDVNSLAFAPDGRLERLTTASHMLRATAGSEKHIAPSRQLSLCSENEEWITLPLTVCFRGDTVLAGLGSPGASGVLPPATVEFSIKADQPETAPAPGLPQPLLLGGMLTASCQGR
ncbi:WD40 repeat domain-containing protein [Megalodesulfovibrio paquesii]